MVFGIKSKTDDTVSVSQTQTGSSPIDGFATVEPPASPSPLANGVGNAFGLSAADKPVNAGSEPSLEFKKGPFDEKKDDNDGLAAQFSNTTKNPDTKAASDEPVVSQVPTESTTSVQDQTPSDQIPAVTQSPLISASTPPAPAPVADNSDVSIPLSEALKTPLQPATDSTFPAVTTIEEEKTEAAPAVIKVTEPPKTSTELTSDKSDLERLMDEIIWDLAGVQAKIRQMKDKLAGEKSDTDKIDLSNSKTDEKKEDESDGLANGKIDGLSKSSPNTNPISGYKI